MYKLCVILQGQPPNAGLTGGQPPDPRDIFGKRKLGLFWQEGFNGGRGDDDGVACVRIGDV